MIDKIDRPEAPPSYQITKPKDAKEDQHRPPSQREEQEKRYQKELTEKEWGKFDSRTVTIKPLRVSRESIARCLFRSVNLRSGAGILQVDVVSKDGSVLRGALVLLAGLEDFIALKKYQQGQEVPENFWARKDTVEFGIIETRLPATPFVAPETGIKGTPEKPGGAGLLRFIGLTDAEGKKINWVVAALYGFFVIMAFLIIVAIF